MDFDKIYFISLFSIIFFMIYLWNKDRDIEYRDIDISCEKCNKEIDTVIESENKYLYECPKCKHKGFIEKED